MAIKYYMRAYNTNLSQYVDWVVDGQPDTTGEQSGYSTAQLSNITVNKVVPAIDGYFRFGLTGPTITQGSGAPSASAPNGSIFLRTDGTSSTGIYTRQSGAWAAIEGGGGGGGSSPGGTGTAIQYRIDGSTLGGSGNISVADGYDLAFGTTYASSGDIRLPQGEDEDEIWTVRQRNANDTGNITLFSLFRSGNSNTFWMGSDPFTGDGVETSVDQDTGYDAAYITSRSDITLELVDENTIFNGDYSWATLHTIEDPTATGIYAGKHMTAFEVGQHVNFSINGKGQYPNASDFGGGRSVFFFGEANVIPSTNPTEGIVLYVDEADNYLKYRQTDGTVITLDGYGSGGGSLAVLNAYTDGTVVLANEEDIKFSTVTVGPTGLSYSAATGEVTFITAGVYEITYEVWVTESDTPGSNFFAVLNGSGLPESGAGTDPSNTLPTGLRRTFQVSIEEGDVLSIRNFIGWDVTIGSNQGSPSASLAITMLNAASDTGGGGNFVAGGDLSGTETSQTVIAINGASVPAGGALTTGHVLQVNGASSTTYGFIANSNVASNAAITYSKLNLSGSIVNADVNSSAAIAGTKISPDFGSQNVVTTGIITGASLRTGGTSGPQILTGSGAPASTPVAGSVYLRQDGSTSTTLYTYTDGYWSTFGSIAGVCTLEQFGAVGNGSTDDSSAMTAALTAISAGRYKAIQLGANKTYLLTGPFTIPAGTHINGYGNTSVIKTTANATVFNCSAEDIVLSNFKILGSGAGSNTLQHGIVCGNPTVSDSGPARGTVDNVQLIELDGYGYAYSQNTFDTFGGPNISNVVARECGTGFYLGTRGEYVNFTNCVAEDCTLGIYVGAGNINWNGGAALSNTTGIQVAAGSNDAHGIFSGVNINHNTTNVVVGAITGGHTFSGCHIFDGPIQLTNSTGVHFIGCQIDVTGYTFNGSVGTRFDSCLLGTAYGNSITELNSPNTSWMGSKTLTGIAPSWLGQRQSGPYTRGTEIYIGTDSAFTSGTQASAIRLYTASAGTGYFGAASAATGYWTSGGLFLTSTKNLAVLGNNASATFGSGSGVIFLGNANTNPSSNPTNGVVAYVDSSDGYLKYRHKDGYVISLNGAGGGSFTASGDLSGNSSSQTVIRINGATVPAAGSLTTGHVLQVSGSSATTYGFIANSNVSASAAIAYSKLNLSGSIVNADVATGAAIAYSKLSLSNSIVNSDVSSSAAIAYSKLSLSNSIVNSDVSSSAAIAYSKLNLASSIVNADVSASAAIAGTKISPDFGSQDVVTTGFITGGSLRTGTTTAQSGAIRLANNTGIKFRNAANSADIDLVRSDNSNWVYLGQSSSAQGGTAIYGGGGVVQLYNTTGHHLTWTWSTTDSTYVQQHNASFNHRIEIASLNTASATGKPLTILGQTTTGTSSTGGALNLSSGNGTSAPGALNLQVGGTNVISLTGPNAATSKITDTTTNGNSKVTVSDIIRNVQTTNATTTDIYTFTITDEAVTTIDVLVTAVQSDGYAGAAYKRTITFKRDGGTVTTIGSVRDNMTDENSSDWDCTIDNNTSTARIRVTGVSSTTIQWGMAARIQVVIP